MRVWTTVTMRLESDTIFGSGYSIPGGEDIAVKTDQQGHPYLSGSTFKGLLRQATDQLLLWQGESERWKILNDLFGQAEAIQRGTSPRQILLTPLTLTEPTEDWKGNRTFTNVDPETGTADKGTLRMAACIRKGLTFTGRITCQAEDSTLLSDAVGCIKYVGTRRTRGFGRVKMTVSEWTAAVEPEEQEIPGTGDTLTYRLYLKEPVRVTDRADSHDTFLSCLGYLPASAIRGHVLHRLAEQRPEWFQAHKKQLLRQVRFTDALPRKGGLAQDAVVLPAVKGFYEDKLEQTFYSILHTKTVQEGTKRAKLGQFCTISPVDGAEACMEIQGWSAKTQTDTRNDRKEKRLFQTEQLSPGQWFAGHVLLDGCSEAVKEAVAGALTGELRLGAGVHAGMGLCEVHDRRWEPEAPECAAYGYRAEDAPSSTLYLLLLSPLALADEYGRCCGGSRERFEQLLGVPVRQMFCATSVIQVQGFNRTWGTRLPTTVAYDRGSMFRLDCACPPPWQTLKKLERSGLGLRREEGFGRVVFLRDFAQVRQKKRRTQTASQRSDRTAELRRSRVRWLNTTSLPQGLSASQMGHFQLFTQGLVEENQLEAVRVQLEQWFVEMEQKRPDDREKAIELHRFVQDLFQDDVQLPLAHPERPRERILLLSELIDLSRKEEI